MSNTSAKLKELARQKCYILQLLYGANDLLDTRPKASEGI